MASATAAQAPEPAAGAVDPVPELDPLDEGTGPDGRPWHRTEVLGRATTYAVTGPAPGSGGPGLPAVLLHGWGLGHRPYRAAIDRLVELGCRVHAPALPGFGGTGGLPSGDDGLAIEHYADWVDAFLEAVGVDEPVLLVGHSFGGGVGIATAHRHPERVRALVLVNSIGGATWRAGDDGASELTLADRPWWDWGIHFPRDLLPVEQGRRVLPVVLREAVPNLVRNPLAMWRAAELARTADLTTELEELKARRLPVLALWGARDGVIPQASFDALCRAVGAEGTVVDGTHSWLLADPAAFGEVITNAVEVARLARLAEERDRVEGGGDLDGRPGRLRSWWRRRRARRGARRVARGLRSPRRGRRDPTAGAAP